MKQTIKEIAIAALVGVALALVGTYAIDNLLTTF